MITPPTEDTAESKDQNFFPLTFIKTQLYYYYYNIDVHCLH